MANKINKSLSTYVNRGRPETGEREIFRVQDRIVNFLRGRRTPTKGRKRQFSPDFGKSQRNRRIFYIKTPSRRNVSPNYRNYSNQREASKKKKEEKRRKNPKEKGKIRCFVRSRSFALYNQI